MAVEVDGADRSPTRGVRPARGGGPPRWVELVPPAVLLVAFAVMALLRPNAVRDLFSGTQAILVTAAIIAGWLLLSRLILPRLVRNAWVRVGILGALAVALVLVLILPAVRDKKVVETFPSAAPAAAPSDSTDGSTPSTVAAEDTTAPTRLGAGALTGIDHDATGTAVLYEQSDGAFVVGLEDIDVEPGPDYFVYLVPGSDRTEPGDQGVELDALRGNQGTQFYAVPDTTTPTAGGWTVLVWCRAFAVPIANATPV